MLKGNMVWACTIPEATYRWIVYAAPTDDSWWTVDEMKVVLKSESKKTKKFPLLFFHQIRAGARPPPTLRDAFLVSAGTQ